jgi:hypothetical protein
MGELLMVFALIFMFVALILKDEGKYHDDENRYKKVIIPLWSGCIVCVLALIYIVYTQEPVTITKTYYTSDWVGIHFNPPAKITETHIRYPNWIINLSSRYEATIECKKEQ